MPLHPRLQNLVDELTPELRGRGFKLQAGHALWTRPLPSGRESIVLSFSPDDEFGGWVEPFVGLIVDKSEALLAGVLQAPVTQANGHTLLIGSTKWLGTDLLRQPVHDQGDVLEASNVCLRWLAQARTELAADFLRNEAASGQPRCENIDFKRLEQLFNTENAPADRYLRHELYRALRGITLAMLTRAQSVNQVVDFHRSRLLNNGFWEVYGDQILRYAAEFQEVD